MESRTERIETPEVIAIAATICHEGHEFTSGGGYVSADYVIAYAIDHTPDEKRNRWSTGYLTLWDGTRIGHYVVTSTWKRWNSNFGPYTMRAITATINYGPAKGEYHGRYGSDWSQLVRLRPVKKSPAA